jgi:hypothetical protein
MNQQSNLKINLLQSAYQTLRTLILVRFRTFSIESRELARWLGISNKEKVMAVCCHDELNEAGETLFTQSCFEKTISLKAEQGEE